jgi:prepilin-type N-terminal cleavage/methylation domain-containing protein
MKFHRYYRRKAFTLVELLVVVAIVGVLIGLLLPAIQAVRAAARRSSCMNHVRQLAIACLNFESAHMHFPPGITDDDTDHRSALHTGFVFLLPFMEQGNLATQIDLQQSWQSPANQFLQTVSVPLFECPDSPSVVSQNGGTIGQASDYAFSKGNDAFLTNQPPSGISGINSEIAFGEITDGASHTFLIGEAASDPNLPAEST